MKALYALIFVCLSLPALADDLDVIPIGADEDNTVAASEPAPQPIDDQSVDAIVEFYVDEYNVGSIPHNAEAVTAPITTPIKGLELQGGLRDDDVLIDDTTTAGTSSVAALKVEDKPNPDLYFFVNDEAAELKLPATIGEPPTELGFWE